MDPEIKDLVCKLKEVCMKRIDKIENEALKERASDGLGVTLQLLEDETSAADIIKTSLDIVDKMYSKDKFVLRKNAKTIAAQLERKHRFSSCLVHIENASDIIDSINEVIKRTIKIKNYVKCLKAFISDKTSEKRIAKEIDELYSSLSIFSLELHEVIYSYFQVCDSCSCKNNGIEYYQFIDVYQEKPYIESVNNIIKYLKQLSITKENVKSILNVIDRYMFAQERIILQIISDINYLFISTKINKSEEINLYKTFDKYDSIIAYLTIILDEERKAIESTVDEIDDDIEECDHRCCIITDEDYD